VHTKNTRTIWISTPRENDTAKQRTATIKREPPEACEDDSLFALLKRTRTTLG
jgi:hypothetical protein